MGKLPLSPHWIRCSIQAELVIIGSKYTTESYHKLQIFRVFVMKQHIISTLFLLTGSPVQIGKYTLIMIYMQGKHVARQHSVVIPNTYMLEIATKLLIVTFANIKFYIAIQSCESASTTFQMCIYMLWTNLLNTH